MLQGMTLENELPTTVPKELKEILVQCWSKNAEQRPSFEEIYQKLKMMNPRADIYLT